MILRDYQQRAVDWLRKRRRGMIVAPAGSGKTIISSAAIYAVLTAKLREGRPIIGWLANTLEQCQQARDAIAAFPAIEQSADVRIACAAADQDWSDVALLVVDELHHSTAPLWYRQIMTCQGALWGMTATPETGDPERDAQLFEMFGESFVIDRSEVAHKLAPAKVIMLPDTDPDMQRPMDAEIDRLFAIRSRYSRLPEGELMAMVKWQVCVKMGIIENKARNDAAVRTALRHANDHVLILVNQIEHGKELAGRIPGSRMAFSKMGRKARAAAMDAFRSGECRCLVATSLCDEGADIPIADVLILVSAGRSETKTVQRTGRVLRLHAGKSIALIYDFVDSQHGLMHKHSCRRQAIYARLGYDITHG